MRFTLSGLCLVLALGLLLPGTGCGKKRRGGDAATETAQTTPTPPAAKPATQPAAQGTEKDPNAGLSGLARVWTEQETKNYLKQLALAYINYSDTSGRPPAKQADLSSFYDKNAKIDEAISKGWIVVPWGANIRRLPQGASQTVLAYERDADGQGNHWVVMADGSVTKLTRDDFEKAPKAKGK